MERNLDILDKVLAKLKAKGSQANKDGMARFGINTKKAFGTTVVDIRQIAKTLRKDHFLAERLWYTGFHEARILATLIDIPNEVTEQQMEKWVGEFNSWDIVDQCCSNLFSKTRFARKKILEWTKRKEEFVKRAGFVLIAALSVHDKQAPDKEFLSYLPIIKREATDERNFVKKAVNWALRQIGKRNKTLNTEVIKVAKEIEALDSKSAKWIAKDALRELTSEKVCNRFA